MFIQGWRTQLGLPRWLSGKEPTCRCRRLRLDPLEEEMATHYSILAWEIPWTEEPGRLQSMGVTKESDTTEATKHTSMCLINKHF